MDHKVADCSQAIASLVPDGGTIAIGGMHGHNNPMALVKELVRQKKRIAKLVVSPSASLNADLIIGAGIVDHVLAPYIGFEHLGLAPCFRRASQEGRIKVRECETSLIVNGLRAGAAGVNFHPVAPGVENTWIPRLNPDDYKWVKDPFVGSEVLCVPALNPDVALVHCAAADVDGNAIFGGCVFSDWDMIRASKKVILMVETVKDTPIQRPMDLLDHLKDHGWSNMTIRSFHRHVPAMFVDMVVETPMGCHPTSSHGLYRYDEGHLRTYLDMARTQEGTNEYLRSFVLAPKDQFEYLDLAKVDVRSLKAPSGKDPHLKGPHLKGTGDSDHTRITIVELMVGVLARALGDKEVAIMGANSAIPMMACLLAKATHAPALTFLAGGSGGISPRPKVLPLSSCDEALLDAPSSLELGDLIDAQTLHGADVFFAGGLQVDRHGNLNLIGKGPKERPTFRGPGSAGLSLFDKAKRIVIYMTSHSPRQFVDKVNLISGAGRPMNNVVEVVSPLGVMDFTKDGEMRLKSLHPGVRTDDLIDATGFELEMEDPINRTPLPTTEELDIMRGLDPLGRIRDQIR